MNKISPELSGKVLIVGPDYKDHRGGIAALIETYSTFFGDFKFLPTHRSFKHNSTKIFFFSKQLLKLIGRLIKDRDIRIVHIHSALGPSLYRKFVVFFLSKYFFGKKVVYHIHSHSFHLEFKGAHGIQKWVTRTLVNKSDGVVCLSDFWLQFLTNNFKPKRVDILNNVINIPQKSIELPGVWGDDSINFLFLGRIGDRKGIFDVLDVIASKIGAAGRKLRLFAGGDGEIERFETYIKDHDLSGIVEYIGWVDAEKKESYFLKSHVFILPSYNEGLPISILEAMSYGMPIISTNVGGIPEILENGVNGFLIKPGDKKAIEAAMLAFLNDPDKIADFGKASLQKVDAYSPATVAEQLSNYYQSLLEPVK